MSKFIFQQMFPKSHEQVVYCYDPVSKLRAIIAIHDTTLGPALGGCRFYPYKSEQEALTDALRLSEGMTYKNAAAGLHLGGGKSVIIGDPRRDKTPKLLQTFGAFVNGLNGRYITAEDVGIGLADVAQMRKQTLYVCGLSKKLGGSGNPSPVTAQGVYRGILAAIENVYGTKVYTDDAKNTQPLAGLTVAVQGTGKVGSELIPILIKKGVKQIYACNPSDAKIDPLLKKYPDQLKRVGLNAIYTTPADIFTPCALGAVLNTRTIPKLKCKIVAGSANNQLATSADGQRLRKRGILYAPDYIINSGGAIDVSIEIDRRIYHKDISYDKAFTKVNNIYKVLKQIFHSSQSTKTPTNIVADQIAQAIVARKHKAKIFPGLGVS